MSKITVKLIYTILVSFIFLHVQAQNNEITIFSQLDTVECHADSVDITINLMYQLDNSSALLPFIDHNVRVQVNAAGMKASNVEILEEGLFSGIATDYLGNQNLFAVHTLTGTIDRIISYNIAHLGGDGYIPNENLISIGKVKISLSNIYECISIIPNTDSTFPSSVVLVNDTSQEISLFATPLELCLPDYCNSCADSIYLENELDDFINQETVKVSARNTVKAENEISNLSDVTYTAEQDISILPGFKVEQGSEFLATIEDCAIGSLAPPAPCYISVTATPDPIYIGSNGGGDISYSICYDSNASANTTINYSSIPTVPSPKFVNISNGSGSVTLTPGSCHNFTLSFTSNLQAGNTAIIDLLINAANNCLTTSSNTSVDIITKSTIDVIATPSTLALCQGETGTITYEICHNEVDPVIFNYESLFIGGPGDITIVPNQDFPNPGPVTIANGPDPCITLSLNFTADLQIGEQAIIVFSPDDTQACMTQPTDSWTTVTLAEDILVTPNVNTLDLCQGQDSQVSFEVCNQKSVDIINLPYEINTSNGIICNTSNCLAILPTIPAGLCETITIGITSNLTAGATGTIDFVPTSNCCIDGNTQITLNSSEEISIEVNQNALVLCQGYADQIEYEICNPNANTISIDYTLDILPSNNIILSQTTGTINATPGCTTLTIDVINNMAPGSLATIKFRRHNFAICLTPTSSYSTTVATPTSCFYLDSNAFLEAAFHTSDWDLNTCEILMANSTTLPTTSPHSYNLNTCANGNSFPWMGLLPDTPIDWIFVELRNKNDNSSSGIECTRHALLNTDGSIFSINSPPGTNLPVAFHGINPDEYFVVIRHRNHLDVISDNSVDFQNNSTTICSFSNGSNAQNFQLDVTYTPPITGPCIGTNIWYMKSGDVNNDHYINASDRSDINNNYGLVGYSLWDCIFNDEVDIADQDVAWKNRNCIGNVPQ